MSDRVPVEGVVLKANVIDCHNDVFTEECLKQAAEGINKKAPVVIFKNFDNTTAGFGRISGAKVQGNCLIVEGEIDEELSESGCGISFLVNESQKAKSPRGYTTFKGFEFTGISAVKEPVRREYRFQRKPDGTQA